MKQIEYRQKYLALEDWRWLFVAGLAVGLGGGLAGFLLLESPWWLLLWGALFTGLAWLGRDAASRLANPLMPPRPNRRLLPRAVRDGNLEMVELPGGSFLMGSPEGDAMTRNNEMPLHRTSVSGFRIARTPVTAGLYRAAMENGSLQGDDDRPASNVSWYEAVKFCNRLSQRHGYRRCYRTGWWWRRLRWSCDWRADGYRLPTEAEWEYACRAGSEGRWSFGDDLATIGDYAWYEGNSMNDIQPVGRKRPNPWGLYDMHGNVWEWCWDWYGPYGTENKVDPSGPPERDSRIVRGGSSWVSLGALRSAARAFAPPSFRFKARGFRCVRVPTRQL